MTGGASHLVRCEYRAVPHFSKSVFGIFGQQPRTQCSGPFWNRGFPNGYTAVIAADWIFFHEISYLRPAKVPGNLWVESFKGETVGTNLQGPFNSARSASFNLVFGVLAARRNAGGFLSRKQCKAMNNEQYKSSATIFGYCLAAAALITLATILTQ